MNESGLASGAMNEDVLVRDYEAGWELNANELVQDYAVYRVRKGIGEDEAMNKSELARDCVTR